MNMKELDHTNSTTGSTHNSNTPDNLIQERIKNEERKRKDMVYVGISDTGKGISSKIMPKLFQKFTTDMILEPVLDCILPKN
ncbi:hypothetical protein [Candidatus Nitrosocosmicus sp. R]